MCKVTCKTQIEDLHTLADIAAAWEYALCKDHTGKMTGLWSVSTSCLCNALCEQRRAAGVGVCAHCFSAAQQAHQASTRRKLEFNTRFLTAAVWPVESIPFVYVPFFRFESFGDLQPVEAGGINQVKNYFNLAAKNAGTRCALWTKNPWIIADAIKAGAVKPNNLQIVFSISALDCPDPEKVLDQVRAVYPFVDRVFAVYTEDGPGINCGARSCYTCNACYREDGPEVIREKLK